MGDFHHFSPLPCLPSNVLEFWQQGLIPRRGQIRQPCTAKRRRARRQTQAAWGRLDAVQTRPDSEQPVQGSHQPVMFFMSTSLSSWCHWEGVIATCWCKRGHSSFLNLEDLSFSLLIFDLQTLKVVPVHSSSEADAFETNESDLMLVLSQPFAFYGSRNKWKAEEGCNKSCTWLITTTKCSCFISQLQGLSESMSSTPLDKREHSCKRVSYLCESEDGRASRIQRENRRLCWPGNSHHEDKHLLLSDEPGDGETLFFTVVSVHVSAAHRSHRAAMTTIMFRKWRPCLTQMSFVLRVTVVFRPRG